jgi:cob(I)alamin adenosyltransferase
MKIYTRTGDDGTTGLSGGERVRKDDQRIEATGAIDELNSSLGIALSAMNNDALALIINQIQHDLFTIGAELSWFTSKASQRSMPVTTPQQVTELEHCIDALQSRLPVQKSFILPQGSPAGTHLHHARTICRRAERTIVRLNQQYEINPEILRYLNRLADLLFIMARTANKASTATEQAPEYRHYIQQ